MYDMILSSNAQNLKSDYERRLMGWDDANRDVI